MWILALYGILQARSVFVHYYGGHYLEYATCTIAILRVQWNLNIDVPVWEMWCPDFRSLIIHSYYYYSGTKINVPNIEVFAFQGIHIEGYQY